MTQAGEAKVLKIPSYQAAVNDDASHGAANAHRVETVNLKAVAEPQDCQLLGDSHDDSPGSR